MPEETTGKSGFRNRVEVVLKGEYLIFRFAIFALFLATLTKVLSAEFSSLIQSFKGKELFDTWLQIMAAAGSLIVALTSFFAVLLNHKTKQVTPLKERVTTAFEKALEKSDFNPHRLKQISNEQSTD